MFGRSNPSDSARRGRQNLPTLAPAPAPSAPATTSRRASSRHPSPLPAGQSGTRHHPYSDGGRRVSHSSSHSHLPSHPSSARNTPLSRHASHGYTASAAHSPDSAPMSGGSAFGQINLLADVAAAREAETEAGRGRQAATTMPDVRRQVGPSTRSSSGSMGRGAWPEEERRRRDSGMPRLAENQVSAQQPQSRPLPALDQSRPPPPTLLAPRPPRLAPLEPHPLKGLTLDKEYAPFVPGKIEEDCRKIFNTPTLLYAPKPRISPPRTTPTSARPPQPISATSATSQPPPQWPPQMSQKHGKAYPEKGVGWMFSYDDNTRPNLRPSHSFTGHFERPAPYQPIALPQHPPQTTRHHAPQATPPPSQETGIASLSRSLSSMPESSDTMRNNPGKYWTLPTPVTSSQPGPGSPNRPYDPDAMQVDPRSPIYPISASQAEQALDGIRGHSVDGSRTGSDMTASVSSGESEMSLSSDSKHSLLSGSRQTRSRTSARGYSSSLSSITSLPLMSQPIPAAPSPTGSLPLVQAPQSSIAKGMTGSAAGGKTKRKSLRRAGERRREQNATAQRKHRDKKKSDAELTAKRLADLENEVLRLRQENSSLKRKYAVE